MSYSTALRPNIERQNLEKVFQKIMEIALENNDYFYLIYQQNNKQTIMTESINTKSLLFVEYVDYQIKPTPGLVELDLTKESDQLILKQSIKEFYLDIDPKTTLYAKARSIYGWIFSPLKIELLTRQLGLIAIQPSKEGAQLLRYFDPAVLPILLKILCSHQKKMLLNPVNQWLFLNSDGHLMIEKNTRKPSKHFVKRLGIDEQQWQQINWIESRNQTLARYHLFNSQYVLSENEADIMIMQAFKLAESKGYSDKRDLSEFAYYSLTIHPEFIEHPIIDDVIKRNVNHSLIKQLKNISESQWKIVANDFNKELERNNDGLM